MVYGDHVPAITNQGDPFPERFTARSTAGDPLTTAVLKAVPGLRHPRGTVSWGVAAWAKYVFLGNYDHRASGVFQTIEDQRVGLYDSENKTFCQLDLDPARMANAGVQWLSVANPSVRRTRIFYEGIAALGSGGFPFGYITADLDNAQPCHAATGWIAASRGFRPAELNAAAAAAGLPPVCPDAKPADPADDWCGFDGMTVLHHDEATNTSTVELGNWMHNRIAVVEIDGAGALRVRAVHVLPLWQPDDGDPQAPDACYSLLPVGPPAVDRTRPRTDVRFLQAFDKFCAPAGSAGCPAKPICPLTATPCSGGCATAYCTTTFFDAYVPAPAPGATCNGQPVSCGNYRVDTLVGPVCLDLGVATQSCLAAHPNLTCTPRPDQSASDCQCPAPTTPAQEFRFDVATGQLGVTSSVFQSARTEGLIVLGGGYSQTGDVFLSTAEELADKSWRSRIVRYPRLSDGEHAYRDPGATPATRAGKIVPAAGRNYPLKTPGGFGFLSLPLAGMEIGNTMYLLSKDTIEREIFIGNGQWVFDTQYKWSFGIGTPASALPQESFTCAPQTAVACASDAGCSSGHTCKQGWCQPALVTACEADAECPAAQRCAVRRCSISRRPCAANTDCGGGSERCASGGGLGDTPPANVALGGTPPSLWSSPHAGPAQGDLVDVSAYLTRVPVAVDLPGARTTVVPPALAWSVNPSCATQRCNRVWLFGAPEGSAAGTLHYRTRDQGLWAASWAPLPATPSLAGGPAAVYTASSTAFTDATVEVYARRQSDNRLVRTQLATAIDCGGGAPCQWAPWQAVPGSPVTDAEPAVAIAAIDDVAVVFLAVKDPSGAIQLAERRAGAWSAWRTIPGLVTNGAPSLVFKHDDGEVWLFAREQATGAIRYARVDGGAAGPWATAGGGGAVLPWSTAPTATYTGRVRLLVGSGTFPSFTYQTTFADGAWDDWKPIASGAGTTRRPAAANVNGDLNVVTTFVTSLQEQLVK